MCARILQQCESLRGGRENLAAFLHVHPHQLALWVAGKSGPPRSVFEQAMEVILEEAAPRAPTPLDRRYRVGQDAAAQQGAALHGPIHNP